MATQKEIKEWVDQAGELDSKIKKMTSDFKKLKVKIESSLKTQENQLITGSKYIDDVVISDKREDADPIKVYEECEKIGKEDSFLDMVKVLVKEMERVLGKDKSEELRPVSGKTVRQSFKKLG